MTAAKKRRCLHPAIIQCSWLDPVYDSRQVSWLADASRERLPVSSGRGLPPVHAYPLTVTSSHRPCTCFPFHRYPDTGCPCCIAVVKMVLNNYTLPRTDCQGDFCIIRPNIHFLNPLQLCIANCNFGQKVQTACFASLLCTGGKGTLCGFS